VTIRVNQPHLQPGPAILAVMALIGVAAAIRGLATLRFGSEPWWVGVLGLAVIIPGLLALEGGWLWIQREVAFTTHDLTVRRWTEVLRGRPGRAFVIEPGLRVAVTHENILTVSIERDGQVGVKFTLGYWEHSRIEALLDACDASGIVVTRDPTAGGPQSS
jgi:hypothetical protein